MVRRTRGGEAIPDWAAPVAFSDDLDDAYGQCPGRPDQQRVCIVSWFDVSARELKFAEANGLTFGLRAAVLGFNRWPIVMTSLARRIAAVCNTNYFDDVVFMIEFQFINPNAIIFF